MRPQSVFCECFKNTKRGKSLSTWDFTKNVSISLIDASSLSVKPEQYRVLQLIWLWNNYFFSFLFVVAIDASNIVSAKCLYLHNNKHGTDSFGRGPVTELFVCGWHKSWRFLFIGHLLKNITTNVKNESW